MVLHTFGNVSLTNVFSDGTLTSSASMGSGTGGAVRVVISPKGGHGFNAVKELGGHFVITNTTLAQAEGDDLTVANDFRQVGIVTDPYNYGTTTVASSNTSKNDLCC